MNWLGLRDPSGLLSFQVDYPLRFSRRDFNLLFVRQAGFGKVRNVQFPGTGGQPRDGEVAIGVGANRLHVIAGSL